ncbi:MAG: FecR domain-containing protein, partial [Anaerolineae bacterium]
MDGNGQDSGMVERELRDALDECLTLHIEEQVTLEGCLARYPKQAAELRPLLEMAIEVRRVAPPEPSPAAVAMGRERMLRAVAARERRRAKAPSAGLRARAGALLGDLRRALAQRPAMAAGWAAAAAVMLLLLVGGLFLRSWMGQAVPQLATLEVTEGVVQVQSRGGEGWLPAASGQQVEPGARIRTAADAAALLTFFDGSMTAMRGETELTIDRLRAPKDGAGRVIVLHQERGWTQHRVETMEARGSRFEVRSPLAVMAVRGTEFAVAVQDDGTTEVTLREGLVEVKARGSTIQLQPGWATTVEPEQPPATPFEAPAPLAVDVFPTRPASEEAETATASASRAPTERPSPTWTPTRT